MTNYREKEREVNFRRLLEERCVTLLSTEYINAQSYYDFMCNACGTKFNKIGHLIKSQEYPCPKCSAEQKAIRHRKKVRSKMDKSLEERGLAEHYEIVEYPELMRDNAVFKHKPCGNLVTTSIGNLYRKGRGVPGTSTGCSYCSKRHTYTESEIVDYITNERPNYTYISSQIVDNHLTVTVKHTLCGETKELQFNYFMRGNGCRFCPIATSDGVEQILHELDKNKIRYEREKRYEGMLTYAYDFYLPDLNILIEYDGRYHHESIAEWGGEERLERVQNNDKIKNEFARTLEIPLVRIPYSVTGSAVRKITKDILNRNNDSYKQYLA